VAAGVFARVNQRIEAIKEWGREWTGRNRIRFHWLDHLIRTVQRYQVQMGDRLAGAFTYFAFLSFFPLIVLAYSLFGYVLAVDPQAQQRLIEAIDQQLPGLAEQLHLDELLQGVSDARQTAGIVGLLGLLYAGLGAVDVLRGALRTIWMTCEPPLNFFLGKARDLVALLLIGVTLVGSVTAAGFATGATRTVSEWLGLGGSWLAGAAVWVGGLLVSLSADLVLFLIMLGWLAKPQQPFGVVLKGSLLGAVAFGLLKQLATLVLSGTLSNPVYGAFAVMVGLLLWINLSARVIMYAAAWTATATLGPPPEPSPIPMSELPVSGEKG
jgi:membrane protein